MGETSGCSRHERICQGTVLLLILNYQRTSLDSIEKNIMVYEYNTCIGMHVHAISIAACNKFV